MSGFYFMGLSWTPKNRDRHRIVGRVTDKYPLQVIIDLNTQKVNDGEFMLISFQEITEDEFNKYHVEVNNI